MFTPELTQQIIEDYFESSIRCFKGSSRKDLHRGLFEFKFSEPICDHCVIKICLYKHIYLFGAVSISGTNYFRFDFKDDEDIHNEVKQILVAHAKLIGLK